ALQVQQARRHAGDRAGQAGALALDRVVVDLPRRDVVERRVEVHDRSDRDSARGGDAFELAGHPWHGVFGDGGALCNTHPSPPGPRLPIHGVRATATHMKKQPETTRAVESLPSFLDSPAYGDETTTTSESQA